jgi:hypothetical protein
VKLTKNKTKQKKVMQVKMQVVSQEHQTWPAKADRQSGESFNLMCMDMSQPPTHRMQQAVHYRLSAEEKLMYWDKSFDKTLDFILQKIQPTTSGKVVFIGAIIQTPSK